MKTTQLISLSWKSVLANKLRTLLSMLGVIIGVITIILVYAIGTGAQKAVEEQFKNLSVNTIFVFPMRWYTIELEDIDTLKETPAIKKIAWFYQSNTTVATESYNGSYSVVGMTMDMVDIISLKLAKWSLLSQENIDNKDKVVVLGNGVFTTLFPDIKPETVIGTTVKINKKDFTIVWVLSKAGGSFGMLSIDEAVYTPITTFSKNLVRTQPPLRVAALATDTKLVATAVSNLTNKLNEMYEVEPSDNAFRVIDAGGSVATAQENAQMLSILLIGIASIVFLVSGIGIMNVMFASVAERTKEIGILKSIGANRSSILSQFLLESLMLTGFGSLIWLIIWEIIIGSNILGSSLPMIRSNSGDIIAILFAMATWLFFWRYPAHRASKLDPVDALRS